MANYKNQKNNPMQKSFWIIVTILSLILPLILYLIFWYLFSRITSLLLFISFAGSLIMGVALGCIVLTLNPNIPGIKWSWWYIVLLGTGTGITIFPSLYLFVPNLQNKQNEEQIAFYILCACLFVILIIYNCLIHSSVMSYYVKEGLRKKDIKQYTKGWYNYFSYHALNQQKSLGAIRYPIIIVRFFYVIALCLYLLVGWLKPVLFMVGIMLSATSILNGILLVWGNIISHDANNQGKSALSLSVCVLLAIFAVWKLGFGTLERVLILCGLM